MGRKFMVRTDQQSLRFLFEQREIGLEYQRWVFKLMGFSFDIQYKPGAANKVADALSREYVNQTELTALISSCGARWADFIPHIQQDPFIKQLHEDINRGAPVPKGYVMDQGILRYKGRLVIPAKSKLVQQLLKEYHDSTLGGHAGDFKTYQRLAEEWYWPGMRRQIQQYVRVCVICQQNKSSSLSPAGSTAVATLEEQLLERDAILDDIKANLLKAQHRMKKYADAHRREVEFQVGEPVYLKIQPYRQKTLARRVCEKLAARFYGPFPIIERIGPVVYRLDLPPSCKLHNVFHVSQLKRAIEVEPAALLGTRIAADSSGRTEVLIQWVGMEDWEATWEDYEQIHDLFPAFHLEDKVKVWARGNVKNQT
ncbi:uncharacterized protein LOC141689695 [Apium graveolens]|uniref:uncharacterized protein LOC141689695 n=1 Tax=Apium graveolens TaxID=4045 RepID=UPI003D79DBC9